MAMIGSMFVCLWDAPEERNSRRRPPLMRPNSLSEREFACRCLAGSQNGYTGTCPRVCVLGTPSSRVRRPTASQPENFHERAIRESTLRSTPRRLPAQVHSVSAPPGFPAGADHAIGVDLHSASTRVDGAGAPRGPITTEGRRYQNCEHPETGGTTCRATGARVA